LGISPNPASDYSVLTYGKELENKSYSVFNSSGNLVMSGKLNKGGITELKVVDWSSGIYLIQVSDVGKTRATIKLIRQ
jgi:hypothetical protein